jgi:hypothetical protein
LFYGKLCSIEIVIDAVVQQSLEVLVMRSLIGVPLSELSKILLKGLVSFEILQKYFVFIEKCCD